MVEKTKNEKTFTIIFALFCFSMLFLALFKPGCVFIINKNTGKLELSWILIFLYSFIFSCVSGIVYITLYKEKKEVVIPRINREGWSYR